MTPLQTLWTLIFNFGPAIILSVYKQWWAGFVAIAVIFVLKWIMFFVTMWLSLPIGVMRILAWIENPIIAGIVLAIGWKLL